MDAEQTGDWVLKAGTIIKFRGIPLRLCEDTKAYGNLSEIPLLSKEVIKAESDLPDNSHN